MQTTLEYMTSFEENLRKYTRENLGDKEAVLSAIDEIKSANPPVYDKGEIDKYLEKRKEVLDHLLDSYFVSEFTNKYPLIDGSIFDLMRYILKDINSSNIVKNEQFVEDLVDEPNNDAPHLRVRLFVYTNLDKELRNQIATWKTGSTEYKLISKLPEPPSRIKASRRKALADFYKIMADAYGNETISDLMEQKDPEFGALWIPAPHHFELEIKPLPQPIDPALVMCVRKRLYLVDTWRIEEEMPFERYIREFTV